MIKIIYLAIITGMLTIATSAFGKGVTVELSITGPGLSTPVHTSAAEAIDVNLWGGDFADWENGIVDGPSPELAQHLVHFWVQVPRSDVIQMKYVVGYVWDTELQKALVYLPGPGEQWYRTNIYSIRRKGEDGHWFYATKDWGEAIKKVLQSSRIE